MRIVSLLPSATDIVCALGLRRNLVGVTHECDAPGVSRIPRVTRTHIPSDASSAEIDRLVSAELQSGRRALYSLDHERMREVRPDLIISQTLCDVCAVNDADLRSFVHATAFDGQAPRVVYLEPTRFEHVFSNIAEVAAAARVPARGRWLAWKLRSRVEAVTAAHRTQPDGERPRVVVLEWLDPLYSCGHWTPELVALAGGVEPLASAGDRSRRISAAELAAADADVILIACCGFSIERTLQDLPRFLNDDSIAGLRCIRDGRVFVADGSLYFSRPGPRLVDSLEIVARVIDPHRRPLPAGVTAAIPALRGAVA